MGYEFVQLELFQEVTLDKNDKKWNYYLVAELDQTGLSKIYLAECEQQKIIYANDLVKDEFGKLYVVKKRLLKSNFQQKLNENTAAVVLKIKSCHQTIEEYLADYLCDIYTELHVQFKDEVS